MVLLVLEFLLFWGCDGVYDYTFYLLWRVDADLLFALSWPAWADFLSILICDCFYFERKLYRFDTGEGELELCIELFGDILIIAGCLFYMLLLLIDFRLFWISALLDTYFIIINLSISWRYNNIDLAKNLYLIPLPHWIFDQSSIY